jgi:hypothetical protein
MSARARVASPHHEASDCLPVVRSRRCQERIDGWEWGAFGLLHLFHPGGERVGLDNRLEERRPRAIPDSDGLRFDQPDGNPALEIQLGEVVEVLRESTELISVLFGHDDQAAGPTCDGVGETPSEVVMICSAVLILDDEL